MKDMKKILIVDDVELNRAILGELFHQQYDILEAENGIEALKQIELYKDSISVILLDIVMPLLDGFGVLDEMKAREWAGKIPVIMITAETSADVMQKGYEKGAADVISKPFAPSIIRQRIANIVEQYSYKLKLEELVEQQTQELRNQANKLRENSAQLIDILSAVIEFKNTESVSHIQNMRILTKTLMKEVSIQHVEYGIDDELIEVISEAAAMHDIGKIAIPDHILNKPGKLTDEEFEIMKTHTLQGCEILAKLSSVQQLEYYDYCYEICRHHHERWDGKGYPDALKGNEIPIWAQVVSLADVYDALTSKRVYKDAYTSKEAVAMILNNECGVFNPVLIKCFKKIIPMIENGFHEPVKSTPIKSVDSKEILNKHKWKHDDISSRTLRLLEVERQKYRIMSELSNEILFEYDVNQDILVFSDKYQILTKQDPRIENFTATLTNNNCVEKESHEQMILKLEQITVEKPSCKVEMKIQMTNQLFEWYEVYLYAIWDSEYENKCVGYIGKLINIEKQKQESIKLQEDAEHDFLTGVLNRKALEKRISQALQTKTMGMAAMCFIDVDNFKQVNDIQGHLIGDSILKQFTKKLQEFSSEGDFVGRMGGDEFAIYISSVDTETQLKERLKRLCENLSKDYQECDISGSIGIAVYPRDGQDFESLLEHADQALYASKRLGKNRYEFYQDSEEAL